MKKLSKVLVCSAAVVATAGFSQVALADFSGNVGVTSDYIWRGAPQSSDESAISGGLDYSHSSGAYVGTWVSSLGGGSQYEQDWYVGFGGEAGPVSYDISYIKYTYPVGDAVELDFSEVNLSLGYGPVTFLYAPTVDKEVSGTNQDDVYMALSAEFEVKKDLTLGLLYGSYDFDGGDTDDYKHYQISLSKGDFTFAYDKKDPEVTDTTGVADAARFSVSWSHSIDL